MRIPNFVSKRNQVMRLIIHPEDSIKKVQKEIQKEYPNIKIEFFSKEHKKGKITNVKFQYFNKDITMESIGLHKKMELDLNDDTVIWDIEKKFEHLGNLHVQVFRRGGEVWLETTKSDNWTLSKANNLEDFSSIDSIII